jgi:hypothetical protein
MPRRAQDVGSDELAGVECRVDLRVRRRRDALPERPLRPRVVLRLDCDEATNGGSRRRERLSDESLRGQPPRGD